MTNYNERLDEILKVYFWPDGVGESETLQATHDAAKQAFTSLTKELVAEAKPTRSEKQIGNFIIYGDLSKRDLKIIDQFEQNLLKELEEV